jgi:hypothetical protein
MLRTPAGSRSRRTAPADALPLNPDGTQQWIMLGVASERYLRFIANSHGNHLRIMCDAPLRKSSTIAC